MKSNTFKLKTFSHKDVPDGFPERRTPRKKNDKALRPRRRVGLPCSITDSRRLGYFSTPTMWL